MRYIALRSKRLLSPIDGESVHREGAIKELVRCAWVLIHPHSRYHLACPANARHLRDGGLMLAQRVSLPSEAYRISVFSSL